MGYAAGMDGLERILGVRDSDAYITIRVRGPAVVTARMESRSYIVLWNPDPYGVRAQNLPAHNEPHNAAGKTRASIYRHQAQG